MKNLYDYSSSNTQTQSRWRHKWITSNTLWSTSTSTCMTSDCILLQHSLIGCMLLIYQNIVARCSQMWLYLRIGNNILWIFLFSMFPRITIMCLSGYHHNGFMQLLNLATGCTVTHCGEGFHCGITSAQTASIEWCIVQIVNVQHEDSPPNPRDCSH